MFNYGLLQTGEEYPTGFGLARTIELYSVLFLGGFWSRLNIFVIILREKKFVLMPENKISLRKLHRVYIIKHRYLLKTIKIHEQTL